MSELAVVHPAINFDPDVLSSGNLRGRLVFRPEDILQMPVQRVGEVIWDHHGQNLGDLALDLTARQPWAPAGHLDFYAPGRWDCEQNLVYMVAIHQVGQSIGEWEGTVGYLRFTAPANGAYIVVVNFSGYQQTMRLNGPWGSNTAHTAQVSDSAAATAIWQATAGQVLYGTFSSRSDSGYSGIAYLHSVQIFTPA